MRKKINNFQELKINFLWLLGYKPRKLADIFKVSVRTIYRYRWK